MLVVLPGLGEMHLQRRGPVMYTAVQTDMHSMNALRSSVRSIGCIRHGVFRSVRFDDPYSRWVRTFHGMVRPAQARGQGISTEGPWQRSYCLHGVVKHTLSMKGWQNPSSLLCSSLEYVLRVDVA